MPRTKQFNQQEVLDKAVYIFWKQGYNATSMDDLVKNLGINRASLYDTFGGKKQLFEHAVNRYIETNKRGLEQLLNTAASVREGISKLFQALIDQSISDPDSKGCLLVNTSTELIPHDKELTEIVFRNKANFQEIVFQYLKKGQQQGEIDKNKDLKTISGFLITLFNGLKVSAKVKPQEAEMKSIVDIGLSILD